MRGLMQAIRNGAKRPRGLAALAALLLLLVGAFAGLASAERAQYGRLIVWLDGGLSPL